MKKLLKHLKNSVLTAVNAMAMFAVIQSVTSTCLWYVYQPEVPESARKLTRGR